MIHVRRHTRQLGSGKTVQVTEYDRSGNAAESAGITGPAGQEDGWWDHPAQAEDVSMGDHPAGTWYFQQGDEIMAVHPDGTVHPVTEDAGDEPDPAPVADHPEGTWYFNDHGETYAVYPDGSTHVVPPAGSEPAPSVNYAPSGEPDERTLDYTLADDDPDGSTAQDVPFPQDGSSSHPAAEDCSLSPGPTSALGRTQAGMRHWRSLPEPDVSSAMPDTSPLGRALGNDTQEGAENFARLKAYREAGYDGPLDRDSRIPDPDDPANHESLSALARMSEI